MIYFLNRFANLSWKIGLCQMWLISLLFLPLSSAVFTIPYGIQQDSVKEDDLNSECSICYFAHHEQPTSSEDILSCTGPVLFVGAQDWNRWWWWTDKTMYTGAFALVSAVHKTTALNTPHLSNGVYWYFTPGKSFGFRGDTDLHQDPEGDTGDLNSRTSVKHLSWTLNGRGGYRPGFTGDEFIATDDEFFEKRIYNCPNNFKD